MSDKISVKIGVKISVKISLISVLISLLRSVKIDINKLKSQYNTKVQEIKSDFIFELNLHI